MTPSRPYLIRALYDWIVDNNLTPYLLVDAANDEVVVPEQYIQDGKIILNVSPSAVRDLNLGNESIGFNARFSGNPMDVYVPANAVLAIYAKENGQGMVFNEEDDGTPPEPPKGKSDKPKLKLVK